MMISHTVGSEGKPFQRYRFLLHTTKGELGSQPVVLLGNFLVRLQGGEQGVPNGCGRLPPCCVLT